MGFPKDYKAARQKSLFPTLLLYKKKLYKNKKTETGKKGRTN